QEEAEGDREDRVVAERSPGDEEERRGKRERQRDPALPLVEAGRDELPRLVEDRRAGEEDAGDRRHLELREEGVGDAGADDERLLRPDGLQRPDEQGHQRLGESVAGGEADRDGEEAANQAGARPFPMAAEWHTPIGPRAP